MSKLFLSVENMIAEIATMQIDERERQEDRVTVSDFFHGQPPYSQDEAEALGLNQNVNNLFGYEHLSGARDQLLALYTTPPRLWEIELDCAPANVKKAWEAKATTEWNRVMKDSGRLKAGYEFVAGDCTMHGEGMFWFPSLSDWCPKHCSLARRLIPTGASLDLNELTHFAVTSEMPFKDVLKNSQMGGKGWNRANLSALVKRIFAKPGAELSGDARTAVDAQNIELLAYHRQANAGLDRMWKHSIPVTYFFQVNFDKATHPFDVTVISRDAVAGLKSGNDSVAGQAVLFEREGFFPTIRQAIFPMHMNSAIGGEALWHRVKGLGHLNYSLSWHLETLMNRAMQAAHEQNTTFFQAADSATREAMEQILLKHNGIIPEGIKIVENRVGSDFRGLLSLIQIIRQQGATNANSIAPENSEAKQRPLQIEEAFRQNLVGANASNRVSHWFDYMNRLGGEVWRRFTNQLIQPIDAGYSEIMAFQAAMSRHGIPLSQLQPANVRITTARVLGDGIRQKALSGAQALVQNIQLYGPEAQQDIKRTFTAAVTDDYEWAEKLVPYSDAPDHDQVLRAETENNIFAVQGKPMPVDDSDLDQVHIQKHFDFMGGLVEKGIKLQQTSFTPDQLAAFKAAGAHIELHVRKLEPIDKKGAAMYREELNKLASMGQKLANNLQQQQQAAQQQSKDSKQPTAAELAQLQLDAEKVRQSQQKIDFGVEKFNRTQSLREHTAAHKQMLDVTKDTRDDHMTRQEMAIRDAEAAAGIVAEPAGSGA